ncbi:hypothetical protein EV174_001931 [Coemansia sp. RSA 2320]|nr:hypothetical protein EV174_001931 [Coemansia sp. RSA 2320]
MEDTFGNAGMECFVKRYYMNNSKLTVFVFIERSDMELSVRLGILLSILCPSLSTVNWKTYDLSAEPVYHKMASLPVYSMYQERIQQVEWAKLDEDTADLGYSQKCVHARRKRSQLQ